MEGIIPGLLHSRFCTYLTYCSYLSQSPLKIFFQEWFLLQWVLVNGWNVISPLNLRLFQLLQLVLSNNLQLQGVVLSILSHTLVSMFLISNSCSLAQDHVLRPEAQCRSGFPTIGWGLTESCVNIKFFYIHCIFRLGPAPFMHFSQIPFSSCNLLRYSNKQMLYIFYFLV